MMILLIIRANCSPLLPDSFGAAISYR